MPTTADKTLEILAEVTETDRVRTEPELPLFDSGLLDSLGIVTLISRLSEESPRRNLSAMTGLPRPG